MSQTPAARVWLILWKASKAVERAARQSVARLNLGLSDFAVLEALLHKGPLPVNEIGRRILLTSGSITTAIDRLESRKLVRRTADPDDLRARVVQLTATGTQLIKDAFDQHAADMEEAMSAITPRERRELVRLLKKIGLSDKLKQVSSGA